MLPGIRHIEFNDFGDLEYISEKTAAVIVETVQGEWGVRKPAPGYLEALRRRCDATGALLILDEVQTGFGRTGALFAFQSYGIIPDVLLLAKGMGGGMPIGAFISSEAIMNSLTENPMLGHITTFGGHPVSCAAALATLQTLLETDLIRQVAPKRLLFHRLLRHAKIKEFRSAGLLMALELESFDQVRQVIHFSLNQGLLMDWFLFNDRALRIAPPLIITEEQIQWAASVLIEALDQLE